MSKEKRLEQLKRVLKTWKAKEKDKINESYSIDYESLPMDLIQDIDENEIVDYLPNFT